MSEKPPCKLPDGRRNPEYARWYNQQNRSKIRIRQNTKYRTDLDFRAKHKAHMKRYEARPEVKALITQRANDIEKQYTCPGCGSTATRTNAVLAGWKHVKRSIWLCPSCKA